MTGTLYLLPNRIAETEISVVLPEKTVRIARQTDYFLAENAKSARAFLKALGHPKPIADLTICEIGHKPDSACFHEWLEPVQQGKDACIVSESGCPGVADPGAALVSLAHTLKIPVVPLVGPCSILLTLMGSGLTGQRFRFWGYLPIESDFRDKAIRHLENESRAGETELFIETPYRNNTMLEALVRTLNPGTLLTVGTDITGQTESLRTMKAARWKDHLGTLAKVPTVFALMAPSRGKVKLT